MELQYHIVTGNKIRISFQIRILFLLPFHPSLSLTLNLLLQAGLEQSRHLFLAIHRISNKENYMFNQNLTEELNSTEVNSNIFLIGCRS
jgi:hypothetical protein